MLLTFWVGVLVSMVASYLVVLAGFFMDHPSCSLYNEFPASPASYLVVFAGFFVDDPSCSLYKLFSASPAKAVGLVLNEKHLQNFDMVMTSIRNSYQYTIILLKWYLSNCHNDTDIKLPISEIGGIPYIGQYGDVWTIWVGFFAPKSARGFNRIH